MPNVFLSYNSKDYEQVEAIARSLEERGVRIALDRWFEGTNLGKPWRQVLEDSLHDCAAIIVFLGPYRYGPFQQMEIDVALDPHHPRDRIIPVILPGGYEPDGFLGTYIRLDLRGGLSDPVRLDQLVAIFRSADSGGVSKAASSVLTSAEFVIPYRGLRTFREEHAKYFFGRNDQVAKLIELVHKDRFVAVIAASGSGKSSVVMAGLIPRLRNEKTWEIVRCVPTDQPFRSLAADLVPLWQPTLKGVDLLEEIGKLSGSMRTASKDEGITLRHVCEDILKDTHRGTERILLVVDQWEELYTLCTDTAEQQAFIDQIIAAVDSDRLTVVLTLRGDFYDRALKHRQLADLLNQRNINLGPMTEAETRQVIENPARLVGLEFEQGLVDAIVEEVAREPSSLPLLEFLLLQLCEKRDGNRLTMKAYKDDIGRLGGAIASAAERAWSELKNTEEQEAAQRVFLRLARVDENNGETTRRRADLDEFTSTETGVIRRFTNARVLVTMRDPASRADILSLAHEALLTHWQRLKAWLDSKREFLLWRQRLEFMLEEFTKSKDVGDLLHGLRLEEAMKWKKTSSTSFTPEEKEFIRLSHENAEEQKREGNLEIEAGRQLIDEAELDRCIHDSKKLWPAAPEQIPGLQDLRRRVSILVESMPTKSNTLSNILRYLEDHHSPQLEFQRDKLSSLLRRVQELTERDQDLHRPALGLLGDLDRRLDRARVIRGETIDRYGSAWKESCAEIARSPLYRGLQVEPQLGLIPLGRDPRSGLFEFLHWASHEGNIPTRQTTGEVVLTEVSGILLVLLPGAEEFWMGAQTDPQGKNFDPNAEDSEGPVNEVHLGPFFMSKYLMTQGQWLRTTGGNPSRYRPETGDFTLLHPVEDVSWNDCSEVLQHLGLEIPTEAQWEYAARGGTSSVYWTGNEPNSILRGACLLGTFKGGRHAPVGSFEPNPFGLYDVIGNVWEWTRDSYAPYHQPARPGDGLRMEAGEYIALRGCSFFNRAEQARVAYRTDDCTRDKRHAWLGVRPSCALQDGPT